jgi:hypothetical protein
MQSGAATTSVLYRFLWESLSSLDCHREQRQRRSTATSTRGGNPLVAKLEIASLRSQ